MVQPDKLFVSKVAVKILLFFLNRPRAEVAQSGLIKELKIAKLSAIKWLCILSESKIIIKRQQERFLYSLNRNDVRVKQLKIFFTISRLSELFENKVSGCEVYLFGSHARGEDTEDSDIDILVIGSQRSAIDKIRLIDNRIKVSFFTHVEWLKTAKQDRAFYERVEKDKIRLA